MSTSLYVLEKFQSLDLGPNAARSKGCRAVFPLGRPEPARELLSTLERWRGLYTRMMETWAMIFMVLAVRVAALHQMAQRLRWPGHGMSSRLAPAACSERNRLTSAVPASCGAAPFSDCCALRGARQSFSASGRAAPQPRWWICRRIGVAKSHCVAVGPPFDFAFDELHVRLNSQMICFKLGDGHR